MKRFLFLTLMTLPVSSFAHKDSFSLGESASATDYMLIYCSADGSIQADKLYFELSSDSPANAPLISAQITKGNFATNVTDLINGDVNPSRVAEINGGEGYYKVSVNKNKAGMVDYSVSYHCESNEGSHAATGLFPQQDQ